ncbi:hypothetical protein LPJ53_002506 [Coemansia erecta]|uniref:Zn(2)-C6 fungal-type domain-containing protein n=1 Tax=Coemansia erecta TaxID=147472 RepID=A0A9W7Y235_9FUNG|nr:hypothetical protein LPJ53_002506 [Coemansia erecta]
MSLVERQHQHSISGQTPARPVRSGRGAKPHVPSACTNCKKAHLACDLQRPCQRCVNANKCSTCKDVQHKKRGRPRSKDKKAASACGSPDASSEAARSPMETQMFQFSFAMAPPAAAAATATAINTAATATPSRPLTPEGSGRAEASEPSYLFLTPGLLCLRLEEQQQRRGGGLLGHSLLSLINRSLADFVSPHDLPHVLAAFSALRSQLAARLAPAPSYPHCSSQPSGAVDPNTFQRLPLARLLRPATPAIATALRAHLRTAQGPHQLFDIAVSVGAVGAVGGSSDSGNSGSLDQAYFVCRISRFDALSGLPSAPCLPVAKRRRVGEDALLMLAEATDGSGRSAGTPEPGMSPGVSEASSLSPPLMPLRHTVLPSLADMLRSLDSKPAPLRFSPPPFSMPGHC